MISESVPNNIQEALKDPKWREAIFEEMRTLHKNGTWEVIELPSGKKKQLASNGYLPLNTRHMVQ